MSLNAHLELKLKGVTYAELYDFVAAARAAGVPGEEAVHCVGGDDQGDRFELDVSADKRGSSGLGRAVRIAAEGAPTDGPQDPPAAAPGSGGVPHPGFGPRRPVDRGVLSEALKNVLGSEDEVRRAVDAVLRFLK